jgi:DNA-binding transcriptional ArsR family regulator
MTLAATFRALGNEKRLKILEWLREPAAHFPAQVDGDLVRDGVCGVLIAEKLGVTQSTLSEHMRLLVSTGLVVPTRIKQWTFYRRDSARVAEIANALGGTI